MTEDFNGKKPQNLSRIKEHEHEKCTCKCVLKLLSIGAFTNISIRTSMRSVATRRSRRK